jgi:hypothetical protein
MDRQFLFYHADRDATLKENQTVELDENNLSRFGSIYWPALQNLKFEDMNPAQRREYMAERVKREPQYQSLPSRLQSIFAANSIEEAIKFAKCISPMPDHNVPIFEIYAGRFWNFDSIWLDFLNPSASYEPYFNYWEGILSNHRPMEGIRHPPRIEVLIPLPATIGSIVHTIEW